MNLVTITRFGTFQEPMEITTETIKNPELARIEAFIKEANSYGVFDENGDLCDTCVEDVMDREEKAVYLSRRTEQEPIEYRVRRLTQFLAPKTDLRQAHWR